MKNLTGLVMMFLITAFAIQVSAQRPGAVKVSDKADKEIVQSEEAEQVKPAPGQEASKQETGATAPAPRPKTKSDDAVIVKPAPRPKTEKDETIIVAPAPKPKTKTGTEAPTPALETVKDKKGPSLEKRKHAEEKSNGNAFSGKGKGGDKNLVDPVRKNTKEENKNSKKIKKNKIVK